MVRKLSIAGQPSGDSGPGSGSSGSHWRQAQQSRACDGIWERERGDRCVVAQVLTQPLFDLVVPDGDGGVRATRRERVVRRVEGERVDIVDRLAVALERVFFFLHCWRGVEVLYGDAAFDRGGRVSWKVSKGLGL